MELKLLFQKIPTLPTGKLHVSSLVCFAHHFMPAPRAQCLAQRTHNKNVCKKEKRKKARVLIRFLNFHPQVMFILKHIQAYFGDIVSSVPEHCNKASIAIKPVTQIFWFPSAHKSYVYTILYSINFEATL